MQYDSKIGNGSKTSKSEVRLVTEVRVVMAVSEVRLVTVVMAVSEVRWVMTSEMQ